MPKTTKTRPEDRVEQLLDNLDLDAVVVHDGAPLRVIHRLVVTIEQAEGALRDAVAAARAAGHSWGSIGVSLGVSAQAAHQRFRNVG